MEATPKAEETKRTFFVQSMKVMAEQNRCSSLLWDLFSKCTFTAKNLLQHYLSAEGVSGPAGDGQELLFGTGFLFGQWFGLAWV